MMVPVIIVAAMGGLMIRPSWTVAAGVVAAIVHTALA